MLRFSGVERSGRRTGDWNYKLVQLFRDLLQ